MFECFVVLDYRCIHSVFKTMFVKFLLAPPLAGLAKIVGANDRRLSHDFMLFGSVTMQTRMFSKVLAQMAHVAFGILVMSGVHGGCFRTWLCSSSAASLLCF